MSCDVPHWFDQDAFEAKQKELDAQLRQSAVVDAAITEVVNRLHAVQQRKAVPLLGLGTRDSRIAALMRLGC